MPIARYASPFATLSLTLDEKEELSRTADGMIGETTAMYERFLWQDKGRLDSTTWAMIREHEKTRVFHNLRPGAGTGNRDMHLLLTVGTVFGTLNDVMYGVICPSADAYRIKSAYTKDTVIDMAVLESIVLPSTDRPYESMSVRWAVKGVPALVRLVAKHQDSVYLEKTTIGELSNGERVGIHLVHSVTFDKTPVLPEYNRFNMSICTVWRQNGPEKVQGYMVSYFEMKDSFATSLVIKSMGDALVTIGKAMECAQLKKLAWLVQNKATRSQREFNTGRPPEEGCSVCMSNDRSARRGIKSACAICTKYSCDKCRVKRTLCGFAPDGELIKHEVRICMPCLRTSRQLDAVAVAQEEATRGYARSMEGRANHDNHASFYHMSSTASVTSSQSGDEMQLVNYRSDVNYNTSLPVRKTPSLSASPNGTRSAERPGMP